jgi:hypothetical protein
MPHPERACEPLLGSADGRLMFASVVESLKAGTAGGRAKTSSTLQTSATA